MTDPVQPRHLSAEERAWCHRAFDARPTASPATTARAIDETLLIPYHPRLAAIRGPRTAIAHVAIAGRATGITLGRHVFIARDAFEPDGALPMELVVHEVAHVVQYLRDGTLPFLLRYLYDYMRHRASGLSDFEAYLNISYEIEARHVAAYVGRGE